MAEKIVEFLSNLLKIGREQLLLKSEFLRNKVPIKPVLGLTGLGVLFIAVKPLLTNNQQTSQTQIETSIVTNEKPKTEEKYDLERTLYLMKEKERELKTLAGTGQKS